jgi:hypothetical protein
VSNDHLSIFKVPALLIHIMMQFEADIAASGDAGLGYEIL